MDFLELAKKRYSVRSFKPDAVSDEIIAKIVEAGIVAPTAVNYQPIHITVVKSKNGLEKIKKCTKSHFDAPLTFIVSADNRFEWKRPFDGKVSGNIDASIVGTHMMLEAADLGIGSTWVMFFDPDVVKNEFSLPEYLEPIALFPMGYPSDSAAPSDRHGKYRAYDELVSFE